MHGFDEFFGNLYHLNAEEEPEDPDYPKDPEFKKHFGPRGVLHCKADGKGGQTVEDTGPLTKKRMETIDDEVTERALKFIDETHKADKPFFLWYNTTGMHFRTHPRRQAQGQEQRPGRLQRRDGRARRAHRPDARTSSTSSASPTTRSSCTRPTTARTTIPGRTPASRRSGPRRTPTGRAAGACRPSCAGPGKFKAGTVLNGIVSHQDWLPTLLAAAGEPDIAAKLHAGPQDRRQDLQGPHRRLQHAAVPDRARRRRARGTSSSTSATTATSSPSG